MKYGVCVPNPDLFLTQGLQLCGKACVSGDWRKDSAFTLERVLQLALLSQDPYTKEACRFLCQQVSKALLPFL